jgi:hypothetical protein
VRWTEDAVPDGIIAKWLKVAKEKGAQPGFISHETRDGEEGAVPHRKRKT